MIQNDRFDMPSEQRWIFRAASGLAFYRSFDIKLIDLYLKAPAQRICSDFLFL